MRKMMTIFKIPLSLEDIRMTVWFSSSQEKDEIGKTMWKMNKTWALENK